MTNKEKIAIYSDILNRKMYTLIMESMEKCGDVKYNYTEYMIKEPIDVDEELKRITNADYDLACALMTLILREDYFVFGALDERVKKGDVQKVYDRMIQLLKEGEDVK